MLSEYSRRVNTSAAFAQLGKRVFSRLFYPWSLVVSRLPASLVVQTSLSLASHTPCWYVSCLRRNVRDDRAQIDFGCSPASSRTKSSSLIGACEERVCERIRQGLASHSPWFWCSCSRCRSGSTERLLKATQVLTAR